jgi:ribosomal protein S18 acetylase RimI-like enzyme
MTDRTLLLRPARPADAQAIAVMSRDLIETGLGWRYRPERIGRLMSARETLVLVAAEGEQVAGFAIMELGEERAHLVLFAVLPSQRRRGLGRRMVEWLMVSAQTAGMASVHLELRADNHAARDFYLRLDFHPTVRVAGYYDGREPALRMVRLLRAPGQALPDWP